LTFKHWYIVCLSALLFVGCESDIPSATRVAMPISICLPADKMQTPNYAPVRRAMGDPGTTERFLFPHHLYYVVIKQESNLSWTVWHAEHRTLTDADWKPMRYVGLLPNSGDSIYQYTEEIDLMLAPADKFAGRIYAIASVEELSLSKDLADVTGLPDLLDVTFSTSSSAIQQKLQHIYSTPYNLEMSGSYYGSFSSVARIVPHVHLLLYHVAAKVDIQWRVDENKRIDNSTPANGVRLTYMEARRLFNGNAYCFKPMRNEVAALPETGYTIADIVRPTDEALWWEGRTYFYTIPYTVTGAPDYFPLQMRLCTNGTPEANAYRPTLNMRVDTTAVFVPWLRANFNFTKPLEDKAETKTVDS